MSTNQDNTIVLFLLLLFFFKINPFDIGEVYPMFKNILYANIMLNIIQNCFFSPFSTEYKRFSGTVDREVFQMC